MTEGTGIVTNLIAQTGAMLKSAINRIRHSVLCRFAMIGAIVLAMLVPMSMVEDVVSERGRRHKAVLAEIAGLWGRQQSLIGPVLVLPYREKIVAEKQAIDKLGRWKKTDEVAYRERIAIALPVTLDLDLELQTTRRSRGIYEALVYAAEVSLKAVFAKPEVAKLVDDEIEFEVDWNKAYLAIGLSDMHAIKEVTAPTWAGETVRVAPGTRLSGLLKSGFHVPLQAWSGEGESFQFDLALKLNGSGGFRFAPVAERTEARIASNWPHPKGQHGLPEHPLEHPRRLPHAVGLHQGQRRSRLEAHPPEAVTAVEGGADGQQEDHGGRKGKAAARAGPALEPPEQRVGDHAARGGGQEAGDVEAPPGRRSE